ncbi:MAG: hypothetical protein E7J89_16075, partial [Enterobacter asburiae]|nr:hypothetical protein [Enterobacter asburiae]
MERLGFFLPLVYSGEKFGLALFTDFKKMKYRQEIEKFPAAGYAQNTQSQVVIMAYKNKLFALALLTISPMSVAQDWNGTVLGFEAPPEPVLGEMLGIRKILNDNGFTWNLG